jgi:hypothetical protein
MVNWYPIGIPVLTTAETLKYQCFQWVAYFTRN